MIDLHEAILDMAEREFRGKSFNSPSFIATLSSLGGDESRSKATFEGYCAWSIALHVLRYKVFIADTILREGAGLVGEEFPPPPPGADDAAWEDLLRRLHAAHDRAIAAIRAMDPARAGEMVAGWGIPLSSAIAWFLGHDAYHTSQIRNMGLPSLRAPAH